MLISRREFLASTVVLGLSACSGAPAPVLARGGWGAEGLRDGFFMRPRAIDICNDEVYVIDTTSRVQVFTKDGQFKRQWSVPEVTRGTPTAIIHSPDFQQIIIPDTHDSRVLLYSPDGELLDQWGEYGNTPEQFIYPTGIARSAEGHYYISEYGDHAERVHVFDEQKKYLRQWGELGTQTGQFSRAMDIDLSRDGKVVVCDTTNHRIQLFEQDGTFISSFGHAGSAPGQLMFPHDIAVSVDNTLVVAEYGNHRISHMTLDGTLLGTLGSAGRNSGEFNAPRGLALSDAGELYVADTDNNRIQFFRMEDFG